MNCKDCEYCKLTARNYYGCRSTFYCKHPDQEYITKYEKEHKVLSAHGFISFGIGNEPNIKTSPRWCPKKKEE